MAKLSHQRSHKGTERRDLRDRARLRDRRASDTSDTSDTLSDSPDHDAHHEPRSFDETT
ncbi:MAG: hypothetical protein KF773_12120 [Deltaproteobacteria bacterium]|nr:hypothetical protein [Deltaproteobacteria bacterium]MCW5803168.1 hypothetical protein [Deltaproteobacteria bacterium]